MKYNTHLVASVQIKAGAHIHKIASLTQSYQMAISLIESDKNVAFLYENIAKKIERIFRVFLMSGKIINVRINEKTKLDGMDEKVHTM